MISSDVQLFWANNENNDIVIIYDMDENDRNKKYTCPVCGSDVKPVAIGGMTKDGKVAQVSSHFSHFDASKCNNETAIHWWFKNKILINGDSFIIKTDVENKYKCKEVLIEKSYNTSYGIYRPDITIITECGKTIYFEMNYTNKKKVEDYLDKWLELGNPVVEVDLKTLMNASFNKNIYEFKALFYEGKCFNTKKGDVYYDTIGKYKETIVKDNVLDDSIREKIKKLDWFWMETINYKRGETSIEQLVDYIDSTEQDEKDLIMIILSKKRCVPIYEDYINYKVKIFECLTKDYIQTIDTNHRELFKISKHKIDRKYKKNVPYDTLWINNTCFIAEIERFYVINYNKETYLCRIKDYIDKIITLIPYREKSNNICSYIKEKYEGKLNGLYLHIVKGEGFILNTIVLKENWPYNTSYMKIALSKFLTKNDEDQIMDILESDENTIVNYISDAIEEGIKKYEQKETLEKEKIMLEIKEERDNYSLIIDKIINIFNTNKDKIIYFERNYTLTEDINNLLYFKDYRGIEFIVHSGKGYFHELNPVSKSYYNPFYNYKSNYKLIELHSLLSIDRNIYVTETNDSYKIENYINKSNYPNYKFPAYFSNPKINLSFKDMGYGTKYLPRYDFLSATSKVNDIFDKISGIKHIFLQNYYDIYDNKIYNVSDITDEEINKEIYKLLYPMIYLADKNQNEILNIKFNVDFTIENNKKQPWLIKDFIYALNLLGIKNVHNII